MGADQFIGVKNLELLVRDYWQKCSDFRDYDRSNRTREPLGVDGRSQFRLGNRHNCILGLVRLLPEFELTINQKQAAYHPEMQNFAHNPKGLSATSSTVFLR